MAVQLILSTDTLESGFRVKANNNFNEIIQSISPVLASGIPTGDFSFGKFGGGALILGLTTIYYTKTQIAQLLAQLSSSPYSGAWDSSKVPYATLSVTDHNGILWRANTPTSTEPGTDGTWDNILTGLIPTAIEIDFPAGASLDYDIDYGGLYSGNATAPGLWVYAEAYYTDAGLDPSLANIFIPYQVTYFKLSATNHIIVRRSDPGDHIKITLKPQN